LRCFDATFFNWHLFHEVYFKLLIVKLCILEPTGQFRVLIWMNQGKDIQFSFASKHETWKGKVNRKYKKYRKTLKILKPYSWFVGIFFWRFLLKVLSFPAIYSKEPFKYNVFMFLTFLGPPTHLFDDTWMVPKFNGPKGSILHLRWMWR
jgi:hypothetical protein